MSELKHLYEQSIVKWNNVRMLWEAEDYEEAYDLAAKPCAFCEDSQKNPESARMRCSKCKISKSICNRNDRKGLVQYLLKDWDSLGYKMGLYRINTIIRMLTEEMDNV